MSMFFARLNNSTREGVNLLYIEVGSLVIAHGCVKRCVNFNSIEIMMQKHIRVNALNVSLSLPQCKSILFSWFNLRN